MQKVSNYIHDYYNSHLDFLSKQYPGLRASRLLREFSTYAGLNSNEVYLGQKQNFFDFLEQGIPLEYIQNNSYFYKSNFYVNENVLIPRSETEILVEDAVNYIKKNYHEEFTVAEVGVGSFNIGLSILMDINLPINFWGGDISEAALEVAQVNLFRASSKINPKNKIELMRSDRFEKFNGKCNLIVTNPPYINKQTDRDGVHDQADQFEPHIALYLDDEDYESWFHQFFKQSSDSLIESGVMFMEGHEDQLEALEIMAKNYFTKTQLKKDYTGSLRFLYCYR